MNNEVPWEDKFHKRTCHIDLKTNGGQNSEFSYHYLYRTYKSFHLIVLSENVILTEQCVKMPERVSLDDGRRLTWHTK